MTITLPANFKIDRSRDYTNNSGTRRIAPTLPGYEVLADTGFYNYETNLDAKEDLPGTVRVRAIGKPGEDPVIVRDWFSATQPGFSLNFVTGDIRKAKDQTPYLYHRRELVSSHYFDTFLTGRGKNDWLHPRFTKVKEYMRSIIAVEKKRAAFVRKATDVAVKAAERKYKFSI